MSKFFKRATSLLVKYKVSVVLIPIIAMIKNPTVITLQFWPYVVYYAVNIPNNTPNSLDFLLKEIFVGVKGNQNFKNFHTIGALAFVLNPTIQRGNKLLTCSSQSLLFTFISKSREYASNALLVFNLATSHISLQVCITHNNIFQTVSPSESNSLPLN